MLLQSKYFYYSYYLFRVITEANLEKVKKIYNNLTQKSVFFVKNENFCFLTFECFGLKGKTDQAFVSIFKQ